jgi:ComF family protein
MDMTPKGQLRLDGLIRPFRDFFFPPLCLICDRMMAPEERYICDSCFALIRTVSKDDAPYQETLVKLASERTISGLVAAYYFETGGPFQSVVHHLKYNGLTALGRLLGERLGRRVSEELAGEEISGIVPVPLHYSKRRERGYNQSEHICRGMASVLGVPVEAKLVKRRIYTRSQTKLNIEERKENVEGAFVLRRRAGRVVKDGTFLLVDDVVTTGATMQACARVLMDAGAARVIACAAALAL